MAIAASEPRFRVKSIDDASELRHANQLIQRTARENRIAIRDRGRARKAHGTHVRIAKLNGEVAGVVHLTSETLRLGESRLRAGVIHGPYVAPHAEDIGIRESLLDCAESILAEHRYHVGVAFSDDYTLRRRGFAETFMGDSFEIDPQHFARPTPDELRVRRMKPGDVATARRLYTNSHATVDCSLVRSSGHFSGIWDHFDEGLVVTTASGKVTGYALYSVEAPVLRVDEFASVNGAIAEVLLSGIAAEAEARFVHRVALHSARNHPLNEWLGTAERSNEASENYGLARLVNLDETLESLLPEWEARAADSALRGLRCEATLVVDGNSFRVRANRGAIDVARVNGNNRFGISSIELLRLITGYAEFEDVYGRHRRLMTPEGRGLLRTIFPKRFPYVCPLDRV